MKRAAQLPSKVAAELIMAGQNTWHTRVYLRQAGNSAAETSGRFPRSQQNVAVETRLAW